MSILQRLKAIFQANANELADSLDDPKMSLSYSLARLEESQGQIKRSLVQVGAARERLVDHYRQLTATHSKYQEQARTAVGAGRDDLARMALERKQAVETRLLELEGNIASLDNQLDGLKNSHVDLERKIALFRLKKEELGAIYNASKAQVQVKESIAGISKDLSDIGNTIQRAEARIQEMRSRATAIELLMDEGVLSDGLEPNKDHIDRELSRMNRVQLIEEDLAQLKESANKDAPRLPDQDEKKLLSMPDGEQKPDE